MLNQLLFSSPILRLFLLLNTLALPQTTDVDEITRRNLFNFQVLAILNFTLPDNLLMYNQLNTKCYKLKPLGLDNRTTLVLSNTRELDRDPFTN